MKRRLLLLGCLLAVAPRAFAEAPALLLAGRYRPGIDLRDWWVSEKYDGVRAHWDGRQLRTRGGERIAAPVWFTAGWSALPLDGELLAGRGRFEHAQSAAAREQPDDAQWRALRYMVFDLPAHPGSFDERLAALRAAVSALDHTWIQAVPQRKVAGDAELQALLREDHGAGIRKRYHTLLAGRMPEGTMSVDAPLHVGLRQGGERHVQVNPQGKVSLSHFGVLERRGGQSYCEVRIETGRTHQIRVHAQHIGHPVAGDDKYGDVEVNKRLREQIGLKRLFLHAASLEFTLDDGEAYVLNAPLADDLREALDRLR